MPKFSILILFAFIFSACHSDDNKEDKGDYLIFGHFYGMCAGEECIEIFKLTENKLFEDSNDDYALTNFNFHELDQVIFNQVKDLKNDFPEQLLTNDSPIIGCPDCADGGGLFIQLSRDGKLYTWRIDQSKENVPEYLHNFMNTVNEKIRLINN